MFLTDKARVMQAETDDTWHTIDNQVYLHPDGTLELIPRFTKTDFYTFPRLVMFFLGSKSRFDVRPAEFHDLKCLYHQRITVNLPINMLPITNHYSVTRKRHYTVCADIDPDFLSVEKVSKRQADNDFYKMMIDAGISKWLAIIMRIGVFFNFNWLFTGFKLDLNKVYKEVL